ncbi:MAG: hypothetical protein ACRCYV_09480 [Aeromonas sp.]
MNLHLITRRIGSVASLIDHIDTAHLHTLDKITCAQVGDLFDTVHDLHDLQDAAADLECTISRGYADDDALTGAILLAQSTACLCDRDDPDYATEQAALAQWLAELRTRRAGSFSSALADGVPPNAGTITQVQHFRSRPRHVEAMQWLGNNAFSLAEFIYQRGGRCEESSRGTVQLAHPSALEPCRPLYIQLRDYLVYDTTSQTFATYPPHVFTAQFLHELNLASA